MSYRILTDSCCDLSDQFYNEQNVSVVRLTVNYKGKDHSVYTPMWLKQMYQGLRQGEQTSTSAANPETWKEAMEPILKQGDDIFVLAFSSGLSTTYQSAVIAAEELLEAYPERSIKVVDSLCASLGQGLLLYYICQKRDTGFSLEELTAWCEEWKLKLCHWFTVDDLMYLKRGGRVSAATALVGTMLQIKPILHVDNEGHLINVGKVRGRKASIEILCKKMEETGLPGMNDTVFICHGDCVEDAKYLEKLVKERCGAKTVVTEYTGAVIGSHSGPGTLALFFLGEHR